MINMHSSVYLITKNAMGVLQFLIFQLISMNWGVTASIITQLPCDFQDSINITDGLPGPNDSVQFNGIIFPNGQYAEIDYIVVNETKRTTVNAHWRGCPCNIKNCIRLCCPPEKVFDSKLGIKAFGEHVKCVNNDKAKNVEIEMRMENDQTVKVNLNEEFSYVIPTSRKIYVLGEKWEIKHPGQVFVNGKLYNRRSYCLRKIFNKKTGEIDLDMLITDYEEDERFQRKDLIYAIAMITSIPFIAATFLVYLFLPDLRNLHGKCLLGYLFGLIIGYSMLTWIKLNGWHTPPKTLQKIIGLTTYFSFLSAFFWSNVISYDLHRNFRTTRFRIHSEKKRFVVYMIYAWGCPFLLTFITVVLDYTKPLKDAYLPGIGTTTCFLKPAKDGIAPFLYFYMLIFIIYTINIVFFVLTTLKIHQAQRDIFKITSQEESARHQSHLNNEKDNLALFMRLFIIMGVSWIMEAIVYLAEDPHNKDTNMFVIIMDVWNLLQGLVIFILFVMKRRVLNLIKKRYKEFCGKSGKLCDNSRTLNSSTKTSTVDSQTSHDKTKYIPIK